MPVSLPRRKGVLDALVGPTDVLECVGTPYDVNELIERVKKQRTAKDIPE